MTAHIKQRKDRGSTWYLVDGSRIRSLKTKKKGLAQHRLEQYIRREFGLNPTPTVKEFYDAWIEKKVEPVFRRGLIRDYKQHFRSHILPRFKDVRLSAIGTGELKEFQVQLLARGLKVKTVRNIIDGSFRAFYRDARAEFDELKGKDRLSMFTGRRFRDRSRIR